MNTKEYIKCRLEKYPRHLIHTGRANLLKVTDIFNVI